MVKIKHLGKDRKGQAQYLLANAFRLTFLIIALLVFFLLINMFIKMQFETKKMEVEVLANRIIYSKSIMQSDEQRTYPGILNISKFRDEKSFNEYINYPAKRHAAAMIELKYNDDEQTHETLYLNKDQYKLLEPLSDPKLSGKGTSTKYFKYYPVSFIDPDTGDYKFGTIMMTIIIPNS